ncbi:hypothetical protein Arub01_28240 [Actinomadura rubrobrunea]|uniref:Uncharacterized protein n=1 Tax=Actinomadura rubrobrunea TaxID=115335 RepID=A0A9W6UXD5_9ACTN|nr:hypothetical protein Arub01_28240 [Actinomadura rubrobrunea]
MAHQGEGEPSVYEEIGDRLKREFVDVHPPETVTRCVAAARYGAQEVTGAATPGLVEKIARKHLQVLAMVAAEKERAERRRAERREADRRAAERRDAGRHAADRGDADHRDIDHRDADHGDAQPPEGERDAAESLGAGADREARRHAAGRSDGGPSAPDRPEDDRLAPGRREGGRPVVEWREGEEHEEPGGARQPGVRALHDMERSTADEAPDAGVQRRPDGRLAHPRADEDGPGRDPLRADRPHTPHGATENAP